MGVRVTTKLRKGVVITLYILAVCSAQLNYESLRSVGVLEEGTYNLKLSTGGSTRYMVVKMMPNINQMGDCGDDQVKNYQDLIDRMLKPLSDTIGLIKKNIQIDNAETMLGPENRLFGAVVGSVALGVATSAQITAGIALHNSLENAESIKKLESAMAESNLAIQKLQDATAGLVLAVNGIQDQINTQIVPAINELGCQVAGNTLGITLTQYYSEIVQTFGPNLANPVETPLTVQAIAKAFGGDVTRLVTEYGIDSEDLEDMLATGAITGRVIDVMLSSRSIIIEMTVPSFVTIEQSKIAKLTTITFNNEGSEWQTVVPEWVQVRNILLSSIRIENCVKTDTSVICPQDPSYAIDDKTVSCLRGVIADCPRMLIVNTVAPRFAVVSNNIISNCVATTCLCGSPGVPVIQGSNEPVKVLELENCNPARVDGITFRLGKRAVNVTVELPSTDLGPVVSVNPVDISTILASVRKDLEESKAALEKSNSILSKINPNIVNSDSSIAAIVLGTISILVILVLVAWLVFLTLQWKKMTKSSTNSTTRMQPIEYVNRGFE